MSSPRYRAVCFDFGQTLARLDAALLAKRLSEREIAVPERAIREALDPAWAEYDRQVREEGVGHPWHALMSTLLTRAGAPSERIAELTDWLWSEQPLVNLWREPIEGMFELCEELRAAAVPIGIISNSEGKLRELIGEMDKSALLPIVLDSGVIGITKPDPRIFEQAAVALGVLAGQILHVGDSLAADVMGALGAGLGAVWFAPGELPADARRAGALAAADAAALRKILLAAGLLG